MAAPSIKYRIYVRFFLLLCLTFLVGVKAISITRTISSSLKKEVLATDSESENETEKNPEKIGTEKENEFAIINDQMAYGNVITGYVIHKTAYSNQYISAHYSNINTPPPDSFRFLPLA